MNTENLPGLAVNRTAALVLAGSSVALWPLDAHAQKIPWIVLPLAASPVVAILLSVALGVATRSWWVALANAGLVIVWVLWFVAASKHSTSDLVVWASIVALGLHALGMLWFIGQHVFRRSKKATDGHPAD